jgi:hypothetical protein
LVALLLLLEDTSDRQPQYENLFFYFYAQTFCLFDYARIQMLLIYNLLSNKGHLINRKWMHKVVIPAVNALIHPIILVEKPLTASGDETLGKVNQEGKCIRRSM